MGINVLNGHPCGRSRNQRNQRNQRQSMWALPSQSADAQRVVPNEAGNPWQSMAITR